MILTEPLTPMQMKRSQDNLYYFNLVNGASYICMGEAIVVLLAISVGCSDTVIACLGAMLYLGFVMLPIGRVITARIGAARTQELCWYIRNLASLLVASSVIWYHFNVPYMPIVAILLGSFLFYGFRAAGVVMMHPLTAEICYEQDRAKVISKCSACFYSMCFVTLMVIIWIRSLSESIWVLFGLIVFGASLGVFAGTFLGKVDETEVLRDSSKKSLIPQIKAALKNKNFRKLIVVGFVCNTAMIMIVPISIAVLKRIYHFSDTRVLVFALIQFASCSGASFVVGKISNNIGPRKAMRIAYCTLLSICLLWLIVPVNMSWLLYVFAVFVFLLAGSSGVGLTNTNAHYFLQTVEAENRVAASTIMSVFTGLASGVLGMFLSGVLLKISSKMFSNGVDGVYTLAGYKMYYGITFVLLLCGVYLISSLEPLAESKRRIKHFWLPNH